MLIWPVELPLLLTVGPRALLEPGAPELLDGASLNKLANDKRKKKKCNSYTIHFVTQRSPAICIGKMTELRELD